MANTARGARTRTSAVSTPESPNACVIRFPSPLSEPVVQTRRRGALPRGVTHIRKARADRRWRLRDEAERQQIALDDGAWLPADRIVITLNPDLTRSVSCAGVYADMERAVETLRDVLAVAAERAGVEPRAAVLAFAKRG